MKRKNTEVKENNDIQGLKNLIILQLIRDGATSEEISAALKAGNVNPSNIRTAFPMKRFKKKNG